MLSRKSSLIILLFISLSVHAQNLYQLNSTLVNRFASGKPVDTSLVNLLNKISSVYLQHSNTDSALLLSKQAITLSAQLRYIKGKCIAYSNIGKIYYKTGDYDLSLKATFSALRISSENNDSEGLANTYNVLGLIYLARNNSSQALVELNKSANLNKQLNNLNRLCENYFNISLCYFHNNSFDSSIIFLNNSLAISEQINDLRMIAMANNRLGDIYYKKGLVDKAIAYYLAVLNNSNYQEDWENSFANSGLANCYYAKGNYELAINHGKNGLLLAQKVGGKWDVIRSLKIIQQAYAADKNYQLAYYYLTQEKLYSDSLFNESREKEINALQLAQEKSENQILKKRNQIAQQKSDLHKMIIVTVSLIAFFLVILIVLICRNTRRTNSINKILRGKTEDILHKKRLIEQQNSELLRLNTTKDQLLSVIGHDLRAPFGSMLATLGLFRSGTLEQADMDFLLEGFFKQVTVTAEMVDNLLLWANNQRDGIKAQLSRVHLPSIVTQVLDILDNIVLEKKITLKHLADERAEVLADADHVRIIIHNIIVNALKFTREHGRIDITYRIDDSTVAISIKDTGIGMTTSKVNELFNRTGKDISTYGTNNEKGIGIGLMLVKSFVDVNGGTIYVVSKENEGTTFSIEFKRHRENT